MTALLRVEDAQVVFGGVHALDGASVEVPDGALCGLIGPNGSGKSTLLGAVSRLTDMAAGRLFIGDEDYTGVPRHQASRYGIARTFQTVRLLEGMTVLGNVMLGAGSGAVGRSTLRNWLDLRSVSKEESRARETAERALGRVGMERQLRAYPEDLPYGMQRRVEVARALAAEPRLLLLDEPTAGMSQGERREIGDLLRELHDDGLTQVLVEHDLGMIHRACDRCYALNFGKVISHGTPREVADDPVVLEAYLGRKAAATGAGAGEP
jgi:branched-chain amino acid transport system ATP-binding protein